MQYNSRRFTLLALATTVAMVAACEDNTIPNVVPIVPIVPNNAVVSMQDQCDSASFNAAVGAGTCVKAGSVTFEQFTNELAATQRAAAWQFVPSVFSIVVGQRINAVNNGGEIHTFTRVAAFGGGIVPELNTASGNMVMAPECGQLGPLDNVAPGTTFTTGAAPATGTAYYQCCIHPWMRSTVSILQ